MPIPKTSKPRARLTKDQVVQIFKSKLNLPQLSSGIPATLYRVSEKAIRDIWKGRTWSRETQHIDTSRTLQFTQPGRSKGRRGSQLRKKGAGGMQNNEPASSLFTWQSKDGDSSVGTINANRLLRYCQPNVQGCNTICTDGCTKTSSGDSSSWHQSDISRSYNMVERQPLSMPALHASIDEQLYDWHSFWSLPTADPFRRDWMPKPFAYA
jgi:hypothetical protein